MGRAVSWGVCVYSQIRIHKVGSHEIRKDRRRRIAQVQPNAAEGFVEVDDCAVPGMLLDAQTES